MSGDALWYVTLGFFRQLQVTTENPEPTTLQATSPSA